MFTAVLILVLIFTIHKNKQHMFILQSEIILHHWQNYLITFLSDVSESSGRALRPADFGGPSQVSWFTTHSY